MENDDRTKQKEDEINLTLGKLVQTADRLSQI